MANSTSLLLLPGSFMPETVYSDVLDAVAKRGIDVRFLPLKSASLGSDDRREPPNMFDDAAAISQEVEILADQGKDVIVVASSYSGVPLTQSCRGLSKAEREKSGKSGGLVKIGFMPSVIPEMGQAACEVLADVPPENIIPMKGDLIASPIQTSGWLEMDPDHYAHIGALIFSNLSADEQVVWASKTRRHSSKVFRDRVTFLSYALPDVDLEFLSCDNDRLISQNDQKLAIGRLEKASGKTVEVTFVSGDHTPALSAPSEVVEWLVKISSIYF
ncbi:unnamed protein product [Clonostachys chloroleuca]|uniref:AB hydrolase-1 domain-containing protein n=1 Tax=Clonostachys chloroleuca TaxID=1926264 RepID=A0AA35PW94_9HYPO|nr:unnamed protein product [Clonostachys chloroleuca]